MKAKEATNYYEAKEIDGGYKARIYRYDGDREVTVYLSQCVYDSEPEALDAAGDYAEQNDIDVELG